jgi:hypothetical protein
MSEYDRLKATKDAILEREKKHMSNQEQPTATFESWALVELMGHQRIVGKVKEETHFGAPLLRIDVPATEGEDAYTKFYGGGAIYCITPITEAVAVRMLLNVRPQPVPMWDLRTPPALPAASDSYDMESDGDDFDEDDDEMDGDSSGAEEDPT